MRLGSVARRAAALALLGIGGMLLAAESRASTSDVDPERPRTVHVRVLRPDGKPAVDAHVVVTSWDKEHGSDAAITDAEGRARVELLSPRLVRAWLGDGSADGTAALVSSRSRAGRSATDALVVRLGPAVTVHGRVETQAGEPIGGATCTLRWSVAGSGIDLATAWDVTTADDGTFRSHPLPPPDGERGPWMATAARGFVRDVESLELGHDFDAPIIVRLDAGFRVTGRCMDTSGKPVVGAQAYSWETRGGESDAEGRFVIDGVMASGDRLLLVSPKLAPRVIDGLEGPVDVDVGDIVLQPGRTLRGRFVDAAGKPIVDGGILVEPESQANWNRQTRTDKRGRFVLVGLPDEDLELQAKTPYGKGLGRTVCVHGIRANEAELRVSLPRGLHVRFRFLLATDRTPVGIKEGMVRFTEPSGTTYVRGRGWSSQHRTEYAVGLDRAGRYCARVELVGYEPIEIDAFNVFEDRDTEVEVLVTPVSPR